MMAPGFKPVGWVGAVSAAALTCYMLSLNVASERADLLRVERQIVSTKQDIRALQTELGTRGRLSQLEQWNADVLALSAPTTTQFLDNEVKLARFDQHAPTMDERVKVQMAAAEVVPAPEAKVEAPVVQAAAPVQTPVVQHDLVRKASFQLPVRSAADDGQARKAASPAATVAATAPAKPARQPSAANAAAAASSKSGPEKTGHAAAELGVRVKADAAPKTALASAKNVSSSKPSSAKKGGLAIDDKLIADIRTAAKAEARATHR